MGDLESFHSKLLTYFPKMIAYFTIYHTTASDFHGFPKRG